MKLDALVMAGGKGERLGFPEEKPLLKLRDRYLIDYVLRALQGSKHVNRIFVATSGRTRKTEGHLEEKGVRYLRTPGQGYVQDMLFAIKELNLGKALVISADLPLLSSSDIDFVLEEYSKRGRPSLAVMIPLKVFQDEGLSPGIVIEGYVPAGVNVVDGKNLNGEETKLITDRIEFAFNINSLEDRKLAERRMENAR